MTKQESDKTTRRGGGRAARRLARESSQQETQAFITRNIPPIDILHDEATELIETNADIVLSEVGIEFRDDLEVLTLLKNAGCDVDGTRVRFPEGLARKLASTGPPQFTQHARNPERSVKIGGDNIVFAPVYGPPFVRGLDGERRYAEIQDFINMVKLVYMLPGLHHSGGTLCEPVDLPVTKHLWVLLLPHLEQKTQWPWHACYSGKRSLRIIAY